MKNTIFMKRRSLENNISHYLQQTFQFEKGIALTDSRTLLCSIESHHGLLVERARHIYSFSHLTFHEYLTALWIVEHPQNLDSIIERHMREQRWREVFFIDNGRN